MPQVRGVQLNSIAGPNARNQIRPRVSAVCVKLCGLDKSLTTPIGNTLYLRSLCVFLLLNRHCSTRCGQHSGSSLDIIEVGTQRPTAILPKPEFLPLSHLQMR